MFARATEVLGFSRDGCRRLPRGPNDLGYVEGFQVISTLRVRDRWFPALLEEFALSSFRPPDHLNLGPGGGPGSPLSSGLLLLAPCFRSCREPRLAPGKP